MSKKSRKKARRHAPSVPAISLLRPRLDALMRSPALLDEDAEALEARLDSLVQGLNADDFMPILVRAYAEAPLQAQARLGEILPGWLADHGYASALRTLLERDAIYPQARDTAAAWLQAAGIEPPPLEEAGPASLFYRAYSHTDESQGLRLILWYTNRKRQRVRGMSILVDYNPPWEGSVKDIAVLPARTLQDAQLEFVELWGRRSVSLHEAGPEEIKREILQNLEANRRESIRLPRDLVSARDDFAQHVLTLPDAPDTPAFTMEDFDELARTGQPAEEIMRYEQEVGRRVRLGNGKEVLVVGADLGD